MVEHVWTDEFEKFLTTEEVQKINYNRLQPYATATILVSHIISMMYSTFIVHSCYACMAHSSGMLCVEKSFWSRLGSWIWGSLSDHLGRRQTFLLANLFLLITGCLSAAAPSYFWLVVSRALVGLAIGGIIVPFDNLADTWRQAFWTHLLCYLIVLFNGSFKPLVVFKISNHIRIIYHPVFLHWDTSSWIQLIFFGIGFAHLETAKLKRRRVCLKAGLAACALPSNISGRSLVAVHPAAVQRRLPRLGTLYSNGLAALVIEPWGWRLGFFGSSKW